MAIVKVSGLITDINGKMNGSVFQRNQAGLSLRSQPGVRKSFTYNQQLNKGTMSSVQSAYRSLSAADLLLWEQYAIFLNKKQKKNVGKSISGQALFIFQNQLRAIAARDISGILPLVIDTPVIQVDPAPIAIVNLILNFADLDVVFDHELVSADEFLVIKMSRPLLASQASGYNKMVIIKYVEEDDVALNVGPNYIEVYGRLPVEGEYVNCEVVLGMKETNGITSRFAQRLIVEGP